VTAGSRAGRNYDQGNGAAGEGGSLAAQPPAQRTALQPLPLRSVPHVPRPGASLWQRLMCLMWLKAIGTCASMWVFFYFYFHLLDNPSSAVTMMPTTVLDAWIPFQPLGLVPYLSLWVYVALPPALLLGLRELVVYGLWAGALCAAGLLCFYLWPTAVPPNPIDVSGYPGFSLLHGVDAAGNACPSMHVAASVFSALWLDRLCREAGWSRRWRWANALWATAIVWSTVAVRQHVVLDVAGGLALGLAFAWLSLRTRPLPSPAG
jgi:membrane-associated phospholipid phosphatase